MSTKVASTAFGTATLAVVGFGWTVVAGGHTQLEGLFLGLALAGLAVGLAAWATALPAGPQVESREQEAQPEERAALAAELRTNGTGIRQAPVTRRMLTLALGALGLSALLPVRSLFWRDVSPSAALRRTTWDDGVAVVDGEGRPVRAQDLLVGTAVTVYPEGHRESDEADAAVILVRVAPGSLAPGRSTGVVEDVIGYSKICTHAGCPVGLYAERATELLCPCHQSTFDVLDGARPIFGPAARPLPQLPLGVAADGALVARGPLQGPVGPGYWRRT